MATVHFIQQGKGGVGKSFISSLLYQALKYHFGKEVYAFDADPINATLKGYKEFDVSRVDIMKGDNINSRAFDSVIEDIVSFPEHSHVIVDNGASSFVALNAYIRENDIVKLLSDNGSTIYFHAIITGGQALTDTVKGLKAMFMSYPSEKIVVWLNSFFGDIQVDGATFTDFQIYDDHKHQINTIIQLPEVNPATFGKDIEELCAKRMSFREGIASSKNIVVRSRLNKYWNQIISIMQQTEFVS